MHRLKRLLMLYFVSVLHLVARAQGDSIVLYKKCPVNTINYEQGLSYNQTTCIITDRLGFTWVSTAIGLQRYNGYDLEDINPVIGHDTIRIHSRVYLYALRNGRLWISYKNGTLEYDPAANAFQRIITQDCPADMPFGIIPVMENAEGVWCILDNKGIVIYNASGKLKRVLNSPAPGLMNNLIRADEPTRTNLACNGRFIFIRTSKRSLLKIDAFAHTFSTINSADGEVLGVSCSRDYLYIATTGSVSRYRISDNKLLNSYPFGRITDQPVAASCVDAVSDGRVIVSVNNQLLEFDGGLDHFKTFVTLGRLPVVPTGQIYNIYHDTFERIWILTNDDIKRIQDREIPFAYFSYPSAPNNFVRCLYFDRQTHRLLAGCFNGGLQLYDATGNPLWNAPLVTPEVKDIVGIEKLTPDNYLVITWSRGWYTLHLTEKKLEKFDFTAGEQFRDLLYDNSFSSNLQRLDDSTILIAGSANVFRCMFRKGSLSSVRPMLPFFKGQSDRITCFWYSPDHTLWAGSYNGVIYKMAENGKVQLIRLPDNPGVRCFGQDANGHVWIGSIAGLFVYDTAGKLIKSFFRNSGLLNDCIYSLLPSPSGSSVFASSNMGLSDVSLGGSIKNYTKEMGLQGNEFNTGAALEGPGGRFYFGGVNGITAFYPSAIGDRRNKPVLNIARLMVNGSSYNSSAGTWEGRAINLGHDQNNLQVDFAAMGILNADKYLYRYRLNGFEHNWRSTHQPIGIRYILEPGTYTLEMVCSDVLSGNSAVRRLTIVIYPPWWLTWWFITIVGLLAVAALSLVVTFYHKRKYAKKLQALALKQQLQNERERLSRDLHDNLGVQANAIFYGTELLMKHKGHKEDLVDHLHDTAKDMLLVLRETLWAMKATQVDATDLWMRIVNFTRNLGTYYPGVKISVSGKPSDLTMGASVALNIVLIVQEAINNAVRHANASEIVIGSRQEHGMWRIEISDNGKGFDQEAVKERTESYGLHNMASRAEESGLQFGLDTAPGKGTRVSLAVN
ncbi:MAG TPA: ATP-binding protein [Mucilaginibacter sp.]|nr:ATP-binding protein [Mucilaginibacter sp.]